MNAVPSDRTAHDNALGRIPRHAGGGWPLPADQPISYSADGQVLSKASDWTYDLTPYAHTRTRLHFKNSKLSDESSAILRTCVQWFLYGKPSSVTATTVASYMILLRKFFVICCELDLTSSQYCADPRLIELLLSRLSHGDRRVLGLVMHQLLGAREQLGFQLLGLDQIRRLVASAPDREAAQYPYIPPRIWSYQVHCMRAFLDDFLSHAVGIAGLFKHAMEAYTAFFGDEAALPAMERARNLGPFIYQPRGRGPYYGHFFDAAARFGVEDFLRRWTIRAGMEANQKGISAFSELFNLAQSCGLAYIVTFTAMRSSEVLRLTTDCYIEEVDPVIGTVALIRGTTKKSLVDNNAMWVTSKSVKPAIEVMQLIAQMQASVVPSDTPGLPREWQQGVLPLVCNGFEPWHAKRKGWRLADSIRKTRRLTINGASYPAIEGLFDRDEMRISAKDLELARLLTPTLSTDKFRQGEPWITTLHQLRRTASVNMISSGFVSDLSLQYQLKHARLVQSLYYGRGWTHLKLSDNAVQVYVRTVYEVIVAELKQLTPHRYVGAVVPVRGSKVDDIDILSEKEIDELLRRGAVSIRRTLLGVCLNPKPCEFGGIENIADCRFCLNARFDRERADDIEVLCADVRRRLSQCADASPNRAALQRQLEAAEGALQLVQRA